MEIYIASHGDFSKGCLNTLEMILGTDTTKEIKTYSLSRGENPNDFTDKFFKEIKPEIDYVVFTDLFGGSVYNAFSKNKDLKNVHVIAGTNINLVLEFLLSGEEDVKVRIENSVNNAKQGIIISGNVKLDDEDEDF